jgi:hypothetical protein
MQKPWGESMIQWIAQSAGLFSILSVIVTLVSRWAAAREKHLHDRTINDVKTWAETTDGQYWWRGYLKKLED